MQKFIVIVCLMTAFTAWGQDAEPIADATQTFLTSLNDDQRAKAEFTFSDDERENWHFIPKRRKGINFSHLNEAQQEGLLTFLRSVLSEEGFNKVETIRSLELVLRAMEGSDHRDPELYHLSVFGDPSGASPWGFRYEGHHLSLNWTVADGKVISSSPQFLGSNPAHVKSGPEKGTRALAAEEDLARTFFAMLSDSQRADALISDEAPDDIFTAAKRKVEALSDDGIAYDELDEDQQAALMDIVHIYAKMQHNNVANYRVEEVHKAGLDDITFAWMGSDEEGKRNYYRVQGPTFLIEFDNVQNDANHIHAVWRDFDGDFGRDVLAEHYAHAEHDHAHDH
jgi:hypothetical protein